MNKKESHRKKDDVKEVIQAMNDMIDKTHSVTSVSIEQKMISWADPTGTIVFKITLKRK